MGGGLAEGGDGDSWADLGPWRAEAADPGEAGREEQGGNGGERDNAWEWAPGWAGS